jgi:sugar phosphate isomerase/epimerase
MMYKIEIMNIGTRVLFPKEVGIWNADLLQISVYFGKKGNLDRVRDCAHMCKEAGIRYVVHPVGYFLLQKEMFQELGEIAKLSDLSLILHDEKAPDGNRIEGKYEAHFRKAIENLSSITNVSFENATDTRDVRWFWSNYADSVTLDIGHIEAIGFDSVEFVLSLEEDCIKKIQYVHMHRNNGWRGGLTDHWPLSHDCRELRALKELIKIKTDVSVILEINETEMIEESLKLLRALRDELNA